MSINYYFIDKQIQKENDVRLEKIKFLDPEEILKQLINTNLFEDMSKLEYEINDFVDKIKQMAQLKNAYIHICQNAGGWNTLFARTEHYTTYEELFLFYDLNRNNLTVIDEYDRELTWLEFEKQICKNERRRGDYICKNKFDWSNSDSFS